MACGQEMWIQARNFTDACPHPGITNCIECRAELCSAHILDCEVCNLFVCADCAPEHARMHERNERRVA